MFGVIGEDRSDVSTLKVLIRRLADDESLSVRGRGYEGASQMLRKGGKQLEMFANTYNCRRFIICYDSDSAAPADRYEEVKEKILRKCAAPGSYSIIVPVQELESWILADIQAVSNVFKGWTPTEIASPERIDSPKEELERLSRAADRRPRYSHALHNEKVARYLDLQKVARKCPSFRPLLNFVVHGEPNA
jgi:hypothetical protein